MKKKNENLTILRRIFKYYTSHKKELFFISFLLVGSSIIGFIQPLVIQNITDGGMIEKDMGIIIRYSAILGVLILVNQTIDLLQTHIFSDIYNSVYYSLFHQVFEKLLHLKKSYFEDKSNTEILNCLQMDVSQVASIADRYTALSMSNIFRILSGLIGLLFINWKMSLIVLCIVPLKLVIVQRLSKRQEIIISEMIEKSRDFSRWFGDNINGIDEIKLWNLFQQHDKLFRKKTLDILTRQKSISMVGGVNSFGDTILEWSISILLYLLGGWLICSESLTIGAVFAFISYSNYITRPFSSLVNLRIYFARIFPSAKRLFKFLDMVEEPDIGNQQITRHPPRIEFRDVDFHYNGARSILHGVNMSIEPGEKVAIIGHNGSGKSTLIKLLLRFYEPIEGQILAEGINIQEIPLNMYRSLFSVVSQDPYLFPDSIQNNVDLHLNADAEKVHSALQISGVQHYLSQMPLKERTMIGINGARLSGGEKQKLAVARAIIKDAPIVILDEATSGYDTESRNYLHDIISHHMQEKTIIMITHHHQELSGMDRVWEVQNGKLIDITENYFS